MNVESMPLNRNSLVELDSNELQQVSGGVAFLVIVAGFTASAVLFTTCEAAGEKIGEAIYHATH